MEGLGWITKKNGRHAAKRLKKEERRNRLIASNEKGKLFVRDRLKLLFVDDGISVEDAFFECMRSGRTAG